MATTLSPVTTMMRTTETRTISSFTDGDIREDYRFDRDDDMGRIGGDYMTIMTRARAQTTTATGMRTTMPIITATKRPGPSMSQERRKLRAGCAEVLRRCRRDQQDLGVCHGVCGGRTPSHGSDEARAR